MKKKVMKLQDLKVKSFLTDLKAEEPSTELIKGGSLAVSCYNDCVSQEHGACLPEIDDILKENAPQWA